MSSQSTAQINVVSKLGEGLSSLQDLDTTFSSIGWDVDGMVVRSWRSSVEQDIESIPKFSTLLDRPLSSS